jgi:hypothetical protein
MMVSLAISIKRFRRPKRPRECAVHQMGVVHVVHVDHESTVIYVLGCGNNVIRILTFLSQSSTASLLTPGLAAIMLDIDQEFDVLM